MSIMGERAKIPISINKNIRILILLYTCLGLMRACTHMESGFVSQFAGILNSS